MREMIFDEKGQPQLGGAGSRDLGSGRTRRREKGEEPRLRPPLRHFRLGSLEQKNLSVSWVSVLVRFSSWTKGQKKKK